MLSFKNEIPQLRRKETMAKTKFGILRLLYAFCTSTIEASVIKAQALLFP